MKCFLILLILFLNINVAKGQDSKRYGDPHGFGQFWDTTHTIQNEDLIIFCNYGVFEDSGSLYFMDDTTKIRIKIYVSFLAKKDLKFKLLSAKFNGINDVKPYFVDVKKNTIWEIAKQYHTLNLDFKNKRNFNNIYPLDVEYKYKVGKRTKILNINKLKVYYCPIMMPLWRWESLKILNKT